MKYSLVDGHRHEAQPGYSGMCPCCEQATIAKCGEVKIWHWAHRGKRMCDVWWENETEWHRKWKAHFPVHWQEVIHRAENGEKHIADVKTEHGCVLEFQHSHLKPDERRSRDNFYQSMVWVVDGKRRQRDLKQFESAIKDGAFLSQQPAVIRTRTDECNLLNEWRGCRAPVFFDFGLPENSETAVIWCLLPTGPDGRAYLAPFSRTYFVDLLLHGAARFGHDIGVQIQGYCKFVADFNMNEQIQRRNAELDQIIAQRTRMNAFNSRSRRSFRF